MLFYHFNCLNDFIKSDLMTSLKAEKEDLKQTLHLYNSKKMNLLSITTNMLSMSNALDKNQLENFYETVSLLKKSFEHINNIQELTTKLDNDLTSIISLYDKSLDYHFDEIKANLVEYNKQRDELTHKILEFETMNTSILNATIKLSLNLSHKTHKKIEKQPIQISENVKPQKDTVKIDIELEPHDNNVLIVSEKEQKAYLPFFYTTVKEIYQNPENHYATLQDVVDELYVVPLENFKNSSLARFREAFRLIREKEKASVSKAFDLGLELMFRHELNPVIIAACRNLDELDIYLSYLEDNQAYEFSCFEIKFEIMPQLVKKTKNTFSF